MIECRDSGRWLSAHLFFGGGIYGGVADAVARDVIDPVVARVRLEDAALGYFFIRYAELGPHIRLRIRVRPGTERRIAALVSDLVRDAAPSADIACYGERPKLQARAIAPWPADRRPNGSAVNTLRWIAYEPELERYGGPNAIEVVESLFETSSDAALSFLRGRESDRRSARIGRGLLTMLTMLHGCFNDRTIAAAFAEHYGRSYLRMVTGGVAGRAEPWAQAFGEGWSRQASAVVPSVDATWRRLDVEDVVRGLESFAGALSVARDALSPRCAAGEVTFGGQHARTWRSCAAQLFPSLTHMSNNRLGLSIPEEAYLAYLAHWALTSLANGASAVTAARQWISI